MRTHHLFLGSALAVLSSPDLCGQWLSKAYFPGSYCQDGVGFSVSGMGYMGLGVVNGNVYTDDIWQYDPGTDSWAQVADFAGGPRWYATGFSIGNRGYVGLGYDTNNTLMSDLWSYDPVNNTWSSIGNYPGSGRAGLTSFSINGMGYLGMGGAGTTYYSDFWMYDPSVTAWTLLPPIGGQPRASAQGVADGTYGYVVMGADLTTYYTDVWRYDPGNNIWQAMANFPGPGRGNLRSFSIGTNGYVGNGTIYVFPSYTFLIDWWWYNMSTDVWTQLANTSISGAGGGSFAIGTKGYMREPGMAFSQFDPYDCLGVLNGPAYPNTPCNDNNPCTANDTWSNACVCAGTVQDSDFDGFNDACDNCPFTPGQIGTPCDDFNPYTLNDTLNGSCNCTGVPCAGTPVTLTLNTDANAAQTSWDIVVGNTNTPVCSGSGYANNSTVTPTCCLPNGCYDLRVFDSMGDGINPGGFVLRDAATNRIIDNFGNGPNFGNLSKVTDVSNNVVSFCVPTGTDAMMAASCDQTGLTTNSVVRAVVNGAVSAQYGVGNQTDDGYQFWVFNPHGGYSRRIFFSHAAPGTGWPGAAPVAERCSYFRLSAMNSAPAIPQNVLLNIRVRSRVNGVNAEFGPACRLTIGTVINCTINQLTTTATPLISCGAVGLNRLTGVLWSNNVAGANRYQFEFINANTNIFLRNIASPTRNLNMSTWGNAIALPTCFIPYNVRVRVSFNNGVTYCPWGAVCQVTYTCPPVQDRSVDPNEAGTITSSLRIWPNPNSGEQLFVAMDGLEGEAGSAAIDITDVFGRRVVNGNVAFEGGVLNTTLDLRNELADGSYIVSIAIGDRVRTERLMIAR